MYCGVRGGAAVNSVGALDRGSGGEASSSGEAIRLFVESSSLGGPKPNEELGSGAVA